MKVLIFSDIHGDFRALEKIVAQQADVYISGGDLSTFGRGLDRCGELLKPLGERLWALPGNHESHEQMRAFCAKFGFVDFHRQQRTLESSNGVTHWAGLGYSNITPFNTPGEYSENEIAGALSGFEGKTPLYIVVHFPPYDSKLDEFAAGKHAGSAALRGWVECAQPAFLFCGHIHETAGLRDRIGATQCINVGKNGYTLEL
jgi:uncharacterized protein